MLLICATAPARSELPPWAYGDDQRRAPVVVELQVDQSQARGQLQVLRARLRSIRRQPLGLLLRPWLPDTSQLRDSRDSQLRSVTVG
ncbi:MAG: hypothetical protein NTV57_16670 [Cyanobacteria bacterium]|nr:hypothetical protein [Cyanobacteriota bacterium]